MNCSDVPSFEFEYLMAQVASADDGDPGDEDRPRWHFGETVMDDYRDEGSTAPLTTFLTKDS
jgi:hypothetical protein